MIPADTSIEAYGVQLAILRRLPLEQKFLQVFDMCETGKALVMAGLRQRHPEASDREIFLLWARQHLGEELFEKVYGERGGR